MAYKVCSKTTRKSKDIKTCQMTISKLFLLFKVPFLIVKVLVGGTNNNRLKFIRGKMNMIF